MMGEVFAGVEKGAEFEGFAGSEVVFHDFVDVF